MPKQVDPAARRDAIADAVVAIAAEHGFAAATVRAVAARAGASTSVVTHYFADRDDLLGHAARREVSARLAEAGRAGDVRGLVRWAVAGPGELTRRFWLALLVAAPAEPVLRAALDAFNSWWDTRLRTLLAASGATDPDLAADLLDIVVTGMVVARFEDAGPWDGDRAERVLDAAFAAAGVAQR